MVLSISHVACHPDMVSSSMLCHEHSHPAVCTHFCHLVQWLLFSPPHAIVHQPQQQQQHDFPGMYPPKLGHGLTVLVCAGQGTTHQMEPPILQTGSTTISSVLLSHHTNVADATGRASTLGQKNSRHVTRVKSKAGLNHANKRGGKGVIGGEIHFQQDIVLGKRGRETETRLLVQHQQTNKKKTKIIIIIIKRRSPLTVSLP